jgi:hypothetical protein
MINLKIIYLVIYLIFIYKFATTPIIECCHPKQIRFEVFPQTKINFIPQPVKSEIIETKKYPEIREFLDNLSNCEWCVRCGSYAHYTREKGEKAGIAIHEITLITPNNSGLNEIKYGSGHRINFFYDDNGRRVYIDNMYNWGLILEHYELKNHLKNKFNKTTDRIGFKNIKLSKVKDNKTKQ